MKKTLRIGFVFVVAISFLLTGCGKKGNTDGNVSTNTTVQSAPAQTQSENTPLPAQTEKASPTPQNIDYTQVKPNESGKITVVMFHNFVETFTPTKYDDGAYTTTFDEFGKLLQTLYDKGYRLISMNDYIKNNISVPAGCIPMVFTFDDGTPGQFNLADEGGKLVANKQSAVGIMEEFNNTHPDFGLKATFYVNLGGATFEGKGTVAERLKYLIDKGFEIGNHTLNHVHLNEITSADKIQAEIGGNQKKMFEFVPDYKFTSFSLPFGQATKSLRGYVQKGVYEGVEYQNLAVMEVGWDPAPSPVSKSFNPLSTHRVRSSGIKQVDADLAWWLKNLSKDNLYVSDGNPNTVAVPKSKEANVDKSKLNGKELIAY